jgi:iron-sulfur cluster assembly protein
MYRNGLTNILIICFSFCLIFRESEVEDVQVCSGGRILSESIQHIVWNLLCGVPSHKFTFSLSFFPIYNIGMSYVMDFSTSDAIQEDDAVDDYPGEEIQCVVDAKSMLYLYGLELDYSEALIGGGFKFYNPNAEESCGCGSSFGV